MRLGSDCVVLELLDGCALQRAGLRVGSTIFSVNGAAVGDRDAFGAALGRARRGSPVRFVWSELEAAEPEAVGPEAAETEAAGPEAEADSVPAEPEVVEAAAEVKAAELEPVTKSELVQLAGRTPPAVALRPNSRGVERTAGGRDELVHSYVASLVASVARRLSAQVGPVAMACTRECASTVML